MSETAIIISLSVAFQSLITLMLNAISVLLELSWVATWLSYGSVLLNRRLSQGRSLGCV